MGWMKHHQYVFVSVKHYAVRDLSIQYLNFKGSKKKKNGPSADFCIRTKKCAPKSVVTFVFQNFLPKKCGALFYAKKYGFSQILLSNS